MEQAVTWIKTLVENYPTLKYLVIFFAGAFGGELAFLAMAFLVVQGFLSFGSFVLFGFSGIYVSDILWFFLGRSTIMGRIIAHRYASSTVSVIMQAVERMSRGNHFLAIIFTKFLVGTRVLILMYVSKTGLEFKKFLYYNTIALIIWFLTIGSIGFLSGLGFTYLVEVLDNVRLAIGFIFLVLILFVVTEIWLEKKLSK